MKKILLPILLLLAPAFAQAEWVAVSENIEDTMVYIDPETIRKDGNFRKVWLVQDLKQRDESGVMSLRAFHEYDCKDERYRILSFSLHSERMVGGKMLDRVDDPLNWKNIAPGTPAATVLKIVCAK